MVEIVSTAITEGQKKKKKGASDTGSQAKQDMCKEVWLYMEMRQDFMDFVIIIIHTIVYGKK